MATIRNQPTNINYANKTKFRFVLNRAPNVGFFCQKATIPSLSLPVAKQMTPFQPVIRPGNKIEYEYYPVTFKVDEDLNNYLEIFDWMNNLGFTEDFDGYDRIKAAGQELVSDATMILESSKNNGNIQIIFRDMFPVGISELEFAIDEDDFVYQDATVTFAYQRFTVKSVKP
jgi:hypothetical protein